MPLFRYKFGFKFKSIQEQQAASRTVRMKSIVVFVSLIAVTFALENYRYRSNLGDDDYYRRSILPRSYMYRRYDDYPEPIPMPGLREPYSLRYMYNRYDGHVQMPLYSRRYMYRRFDDNAGLGPMPPYFGRYTYGLYDDYPGPGPMPRPFLPYYLGYGDSGTMSVGSGIIASSGRYIGYGASGGDGFGRSVVMPYYRAHRGYGRHRGYRGHRSILYYRRFGGYDDDGGYRITGGDHRDYGRYRGYAFHYKPSRKNRRSYYI